MAVSHNTILIILFLEVLSTNLSASYWNDYLKNVFGISIESASLISSARALATTLMAPYLGHSSDHIGRRPMLFIIAFGALLGLFSEFLANSLLFFVVTRIIFGATRYGGGIANSFVADQYPTLSERSKGLGLNATVSTLGWIAGVFIGGYLVSTKSGAFGILSGWSGPALVGIFCQLVILVLIFQFVPSTRSPLAAAQSPTLPGMKRTKNEIKHGKEGALAQLKLLWSKMSVKENPSLKRIVWAHIISVTMSSVAFAAFVEYQRIEHGQDSYTRSIYFVISGVMGSLLSSNISTLLKLFGSAFRTILFLLGSTCAISIVLPFLPQLSYYWASLVATTLLSVVAPISLGVISKQLADQDQGTLMGANEALFNFGGVIGPLLVLFTFSIHNILPFVLIFFVLGVAVWMVLNSEDLLKVKNE